MSVTEKSSTFSAKLLRRTTFSLRVLASSRSFAETYCIKKLTFFQLLLKKKNHFFLAKGVMKVTYLKSFCEGISTLKKVVDGDGFRYLVRSLMKDVCNFCLFCG